MNPNIVKNYRAILTLTHPKPRTCELVGDDLEMVKNDVSNILSGGRVTFTPAQATLGTAGAILVFHPTFDGGKTPLGWISPYEVPESMSIGWTIERLAAAA